MARKTRSIRHPKHLVAAAAAQDLGITEEGHSYAVRPAPKEIIEGEWGDQHRSGGHRGRLSRQDKAKLDRAQARVAKRAWQTA